MYWQMNQCVVLYNYGNVLTHVVRVHIDSKTIGVENVAVLYR